MAKVAFADPQPALPANKPMPATATAKPVTGDPLKAPTPADPLAAINLLSEEERLALFT
jgi:hypothetical protein